MIFSLSVIMNVIRSWLFPTPSFAATDEKVLVIACSDGRLRTSLVDFCKKRFKRFAIMCVAGGPGNFNEFLTGTVDDLNITARNIIQLMTQREYTKLVLISHDDCGFYKATMKQYRRKVVHVCQGADLGILLHEVSKAIHGNHEIWYQSFLEKKKRVRFTRFPKHETYLAKPEYTNHHAKIIAIFDTYSSTIQAISAYLDEHYPSQNIDIVAVPGGVQGIVQATMAANTEQLPMTMWNIRTLIGLHACTEAILIDAPSPGQPVDDSHNALRQLSCYLKAQFPGMLVDSIILVLGSEQHRFNLVSFECTGTGECGDCHVVAA